MILEILKWTLIVLGFVFSGLIALDLVLKWRLDYLKRKERMRRYEIRAERQKRAWNRIYKELDESRKKSDFMYINLN